MRSERAVFGSLRPRFSFYVLLSFFRVNAVRRPAAGSSIRRESEKQL